jgi:alpha-amylase/alpha-mannosidase (GH57 family)
MKLIIGRKFHILACIVLGLTACRQLPTPPTQTSSIARTATTIAKPTDIPVPTSTVEEPIYLAIIWHQHQPVYYKDPDANIYEKPWVRVHAAKDYVDMAAMLKNYPDIHVTYNLTPSLIHQLNDFQAGARDSYWTTALVPADQLTQEQEQFLLERFFDTNRKVIARFPRYQELLQKRDGGEDYTTQDYLDLQVLFNLAWTDPDWLAQEPLASLVIKGSNFQEADKTIVFSEHERLIAQVVPIHRELQDSGQIEVTMTPYAHPILPLLMGTRLASVANPTLELPSKEFTYWQDAVEQLNKGVETYTDNFGMPPRGIWPAEGAVAQEIVFIVSKAGIQWMASDEGVLAASLGLESFVRDSHEVVTEPETLYRPYYVQSRQGNPVAIIFRDVVLSDKVGFTYSGMSGSSATTDFIQRIHKIRDSLIRSGSEGPFLVSVILDGENAWEYYDNDGKEFLNSLYSGLSRDPLIKTVTPSEFLTMAPDQPKIEELWAGSWINHDFTTWIGEDEENLAWDYLVTTREFLDKYLTGNRSTSVENLQEAMNYMLIAEGSDWFWWFGADQTSGDDEAFDQQFRNTLKQVYETLGAAAPVFLDVPIISLVPIEADIAASGLITVTVDGYASSGEWDEAGVYIASGGVMESQSVFFQDLAYGFSAKELFFKVTAMPENLPIQGASRIEFYLQVPGGEVKNNFSRNGTLLGFPANRMVEIQLQDGFIINANLYTSSGEENWINPSQLESIAQNDNLIELGVRLDLLGSVSMGNIINIRGFHAQPVSVSGDASMVDTDVIPESGPAELLVPELGTLNLVLDISDPLQDDYGAGTYTYPTDAVFKSGCYDIVNFQAGIDADNIVFKFGMRGPVNNPWNSPNGLSVQTFDIYIDVDGDGQGGKSFLPGRNLALQEGFAWDYAITVEGWEPGIYVPGEAGPVKIATSSDFIVMTDPSQQRVILKIPSSILGNQLEQWKLSAMVLSQEGYPSGGVMRVRDVNPSAEQWRFGGSPDDTNHTRVIDLVWPEKGVQESWLSAYSPSQANQSNLTEGDFARVGMLQKGQ